MLTQLNKIFYLIFVYVVLFLQLGVAGHSQTLPKITIFTHPNDTTGISSQIGGNIEHHRDELNEPQFIYNVKSLNSKYLRFPGGSKSDIYIWNKGKESRQDLIDYLTLVKATNTEPIITFNLGSFTKDIDKGAETAQHLVEYLNGKKEDQNQNGGINWALQREKDGFIEPFNVKRFQLGNENYGEWESGTCENYPKADQYSCINRLTPKNYIDSYRKYKKEIAKITPNGQWGVGISNGSHNNWDKAVVSELKNEVDFYDLHIYPFQPKDFDKSSTEIIKIAREDTENSISQARKILDESGAKNKELIIGEYNATTPEYNTLVAKSSTYLSLFTVNEMLGVFNQKNISTNLFWGYTSGFEQKVGQNGSAGYHLFTDTNNPKTPTFTPYPAYYAQFLWSKMGETVIKADANDKNISVWATNYTDKKENIVRNGQTVLIQNLNDKPVSTQIDFQNEMGEAKIWTATGDLNDSKIFINNITTSGNYGGPFPDQIKPEIKAINSDKQSLSLPANSITVIKTNTVKEKIVAKETMTKNLDGFSEADTPNQWQKLIDENYSLFGFSVISGVSGIVLLLFMALQFRKKPKNNNEIVVKK